MNTAAYRRQAYDARENGRWEEAADLYQKAIDAYPAGTGAMRAHDIEQLQRHMESCRESADFERCID